MENRVYATIARYKNHPNRHALSYAEWLKLIEEVSRPEKTYKIGQKVTSWNKYDGGYSYKLVAPIGKEFHKDFKPVYTPAEMLKLGVFEGKYLNDDIYEFPKEWFTKAKISLYRDPGLNYYSGVVARLPLSIWIEKGWIMTDKKGWFQWYCRYYLGRRLGEEDEIQIKRWKAYVRHLMQLIKNCRAGDLTCRRKQRQSLLQWSHLHDI